MSPIRPEMKQHYPADWPVISRRIRVDRAQGRCECEGECGRPGHPAASGRCVAVHGQPAVISGKPIILTTAHLNHDPSDCRDENLRAMCQACHLAYDAEHHAITRAATLAARNAAGTGALPLDGLGIEL